jgi:hypothetical protein
MKKGLCLKSEIPKWNIFEKMESVKIKLQLFIELFSNNLTLNLIFFYKFVKLIDIYGRFRFFIKIRFQWNSTLKFRFLGTIEKRFLN